MTDDIKLTFRTYDMNKNDPAYKELVKTLTARGLPRLQVWHTPAKDAKPLVDGTYTLETKHLFANQMNVDNHRAFDWYDGMVNETRRTGHYIVDDEGYRALQEMRRNTNRCAYCGHQEAAARGLVFHLDCLSSEYLKADDLYLTRMVCVADHNPPIPPLTDAEKAHLMPQYKDAQLHGNTERSKKRIAAKRAAIKATFDKATENARVEFEGYTWLMDRGINTDNVIFYNRTGQFSFGWRNPIGPEIESELLGELESFPFPYEIKTSK